MFLFFITKEKRRKIDVKDTEKLKMRIMVINVERHLMKNSDQQRSSSKNAFTGLASTEASGSLFSFGVVCKDGSTSSVSLFGFGLSNRNNPSVSALLDLPLSRRVKVVGFLQSRRFPQRQEKRTRKLPSQLSRFCLNISMEDGESVVQQSMK
ncbi:unnamed protein product [Brassica rapa subsp. narinosa]